MLLQATLGLDDLTDAMRRLTPLEVRLGDLEGKGRTLFVERPVRVTLVPDSSASTRTRGGRKAHGRRFLRASRRSSRSRP